MTGKILLETNELVVRFNENEDAILVHKKQDGTEMKPIAYITGYNYLDLRVKDAS